MYQVRESYRRNSRQLASTRTSSGTLHRQPESSEPRHLPAQNARFSDFRTALFYSRRDEQAKSTHGFREIARDAGIGRWAGAGLECRLGEFAILGRIAIDPTARSRPTGGA